MRTAQAMIFADIVWPDGVELPEQVMRDLCPVLALGIAGYFQSLEDEHPQLLEGKIKVNWGAPVAPDHLLEHLQQEGRMEASPQAHAVYIYDSSQVGPDAKPCHIYGYADGNPLTEEQANDLAVKLTGTRNLTVMVLPVEDQSAAPVPA